MEGDDLNLCSPQRPQHDRSSARTNSKLIACPLTGRSGKYSFIISFFTCMPTFGSACRSQIGDTTSTECLAWSSRAWRPAESGTLALSSAGKEKPSGMFSTSCMLQKHENVEEAA